MDLQNMLSGLTQSAEAWLPRALGALAILVIGWIIALIAAALVRGLLKRTALDDKLAQKFFGGDRSNIDVAKGVGKLVFYTLMLFVLVAFFQALELTSVTEPLNSLLNRLFGFIPQFVGAAILLLIAWGVASLVRLGVTKGLQAADVDQRLGGDGESVPLTRSLADGLYWLVFLLFLPAVLSTLELEGILDPVQGMIDKILNFLPNLFTAGILLLVGWFVARLVQRIVTSLLAAVGLDQLAQRLGVAQLLGATPLSAVVGSILYVFILIPIAISALNALQLDAVTAPASAMLNQILMALPNIFAALMVLAFSYAIGRLIAGLVTNLLRGIGFDRIFTVLGFSDQPAEGERGPAGLAGSLVLVMIMLFAAMEASSLLGFGFLSGLLSTFMEFGGHILLGVLILGLGIYLANLVAKGIRASGARQADWLALVARGAILVFAGSMALNEMGLGSEIINTAFALLLGAVAVAVAIAFGLGGRDAAAKQLDEWQRKDAQS